MTQAAGRTLVVGELVAELKYGDDILPITAVFESGSTALIDNAERTGGGIELMIGADTQNDLFRDLLAQAFELLDQAGSPKSTINKDRRQRYRDLADEIEEAL